MATMAKVQFLYKTGHIKLNFFGVNFKPEVQGRPFMHMPSRKLAKNSQSKDVVHLAKLHPNKKQFSYNFANKVVDV